MDILQRCVEFAVFVEHIGDAARHAGGEVAPGLADDDDDAAGHIFAAVIAGAFDDRDRAGVAHGEALAGDAAEIAFASDRAVKRGVADDDRFFGRDPRRRPRRMDDDASAREALADIVVGLALELERHAAASQAPKLWPAVPVERDMDRVVGQARHGRNDRATSPDSIAPMARLTLLIGVSMRTGAPRSSAGLCLLR